MIFENMEKEWPENLYFNNIKRVREIYTLTELLCRAEELSDEESLLVRTAALFKYSGYSRDYDNYIEHSKEFALFELPRYRYSEEQIKKIISLIECGINSAPANMPESILADAELNYLTRADFPKLSVTYYNELLEKNKVQTFDEWIDRQSSLLSSYNCYTKTALALREVMPEEQIKNLRAYKINSEL
jgi:hypothetical protein